MEWFGAHFHAIAFWLSAVGLVWLAWSLRFMLEKRSVDTVPTDLEETFERHGETAIQLALTSGLQPPSKQLQKLNIHNSEDVQRHALNWLTGKSDKELRHEKRMERVEWAILGFLVISVFLEVFK